MPAPQNAAMGGDSLFFLHDGADPGTMIEVEFQDNSKYSTGKKQETKRTKNGTLPFQTNDGATLTFSITKVRPLSAGQARLWAVAASGEIIQAEYKDPTSGGHVRSGYVQITMGDEEGANNSPIEVEFTVAFVDDPTEAVSP